MKSKNPYLFLFIMVVVLVLFAITLLRIATAAELDTNSGILDSMIGYKVKDFSGNTQYLVTPTPSGDFIVRDPKNRYPLYKVENGKIYNFKREPQQTINK